MHNSKYRERLYRGYSAHFDNARIVYATNTVKQLSKAYGYYLRDWLPSQRDAPLADVACGDGKLLFHLKASGYVSLSGVDASPSQVDCARQVVPSVEHGQVSDFLERHPNAFEVITCLDMIEHLTKDEAFSFVENCYGSLKRGGRLILQTPNCETPMGAALRFSDFTHEIGLGPTSTGQLLRACGFEQVEFRELGPVPAGYSVLCSLRYVLWQAVRLFFKAINLAETGGKGSGIWTRVFLASAVKPDNA